jgi:hypothetical protein
VNAEARLKRAIDNELARRERAHLNAPRNFTAALLCHAKQAAFVAAVMAHRFVTVCAGRQSGKSHAAVAAGIEMCLSRANVSVLYIASTHDSVKRMAWKAARAFNDEHKLGAVPNYTDLSLTFSNGSQLVLIGVDTEKAADRVRGIQRLIAAFVDETQLFPPEVSTALLRDAIRPALRPLRGKLILMGTPNKLGALGPWWDAILRSEALGKADGSQHHFKWTVYDTVGILIDGVPVTLDDIEATIQEDLEIEKQTKDSAWFQVEYMAEWVVDMAARAYHFTDEANVYDELPEGLEFALTFGDIGVNDEDAFGSLRWSSTDPTLYLVEHEIAPGLTTRDEEVILGRVWEELSPLEVVLDTGGQGAKTFITVQEAMPYLPLVAARKPSLNVQVKRLNDVLDGGWLKVHRDSRFRSDVRKATWKNGVVNGKLMETGAAKSNIVPGVRYGVIHVTQYLPERPVIGAKQEPIDKDFARELDAHIEALEGDQSERAYRDAGLGDVLGDRL